MIDDTPPPAAQKIVIALRAVLEPWQHLNVTAFLASGIAAARPDLVGAEYVDGSAQRYLPLFGLPVMIKSASADALSAIRRKAVERGFGVALFTEDMFATGDDDANRAVVAAVASDALPIVGLGLVGPKNAIDKATKAAALFR